MIERFASLEAPMRPPFRVEVKEETSFKHFVDAMQAVYSV